MAWKTALHADNYRANLIIAKLTYASSAWWDLLVPQTANDWTPLFAEWSLLFVPQDLAEFADLCRLIDESLFREVTINRDHVLRSLLPPINGTSLIQE